MYHLKLMKALSFTGIVTATKKNPDAGRGIVDALRHCAACVYNFIQ